MKVATISALLVLAANSALTINQLNGELESLTGVKEKLENNLSSLS